MKKLLALALSVCLIFCLSGCIFEEISLLYSEDAEKDGFNIAINKKANCCYVSSYNCTEYTENMEITIPDDYNGIPIKRLGGYFGRGAPEPFTIWLPESYVNAPAGSEYAAVFRGDIEECNIEEEYVVEDLVFNLNIGKNVKVIEYVVMDHFFPHINEDGSITFYHAVVNINCSEENKRFYSKDGKLYNKRTDELITDFAYATKE